MAEQARSSRRRKRLSIVELMRGDIVRLVASSQINKNIYFIDYIDETNIRLIADMRTEATNGRCSCAAKMTSCDETSVDGCVVRRRGGFDAGRRLAVGVRDTAQWRMRSHWQ